MKTYTAFEVIEKIPSLIASRSSFEIIGASGKILDLCSILEEEIESQGLRCRIYTRNRSIAAGGMAWTGAGIASLIGIAAHNLATFSPDYEIGKAIVDNKIYVEFKK